MISQIVAVITIAVGVLLAVTVVSLLLDWLLRADIAVPAMDACTINQLRSSEKDDVIIIFLPGILAASSAMSDRILDVWARFGQVWGVDYTPPRFRPEHIVSLVRDQLLRACLGEADVKRVVLIGSSMGSLLAYDIRQSLEKSSMFNVDVDLVVVDAPTGRKDFQPLLYWTSWFVHILPFGPLWNHLSKPIMKKLVIPPKEGEIDADVDRDWLDQQVAGARSFPLSFWRDQVMFILNHGAPAPDSVDEPLVYIRSTKDDDTVRPEAEEKWHAAYIGPANFWHPQKAEGAKHAAFAQNPRAYEEVFSYTLWWLGL